MQVGAWTLLSGALLLVQLPLALRVISRIITSATGGMKIAAADDDGDQASVTVIVPVLDEERRVAECLNSLRAQGQAVREIIVVDGGSGDGTQDVVRAAASADARCRLVVAPPVPLGWNGKAWNLQVGLRGSSPASRFVLSIDADVRAQPALAAALVAHARKTKLAAFSVATKQRVEDSLSGIIHPSMLATLVYRFGIPGSITSSVRSVQANGQCFLAERDVLLKQDAIVKARDSRCEDVTIARALALSGTPVGFFESAHLAETTMYEDWRELVRNWPRSLTMLDRYSGIEGWIGLLEIAFVQALPLWLWAILLVFAPATFFCALLLVVQGALAAMRLGILFGTRRAYSVVPPTYWLSPVFDSAAGALLVASAFRRRHVWRGRPLASQVAR